MKQGFFRNFRSRLWTHAAQMEEQQKIESLQFNSEEDRFLFMEARLGLEVGEFWESDAGRYLAKRCEQVIAHATAKFAAVDPMDAGAIMKLQVELRAAQMLVTMVTNAIQNGESSELQIKNNEELTDE